MHTDVMIQAAFVFDPIQRLLGPTALTKIASKPLFWCARKNRDHNGNCKKCLCLRFAGRGHGRKNSRDGIAHQFLISGQSFFK